MGIGEAERKGLIYTPKPDRSPIVMEKPGEIALVRTLRAGRDRAMEMTSAAAKSLRARMDAGETASRPVSATGGNPSAGRLAKMAQAGLRYDRANREAGGSGWVSLQGEDNAVRREVGLAGVDADLAVTMARSSAAQAELDRRAREFEATDANAKKRLEIDERTAGPKGLDRADDADIAAGISKYGKPKPMNPAELSRADPNRWAAWNRETDPAKKASLLEEPWKDDDRRVYENYLAEYRRRGLGAGNRQPATGNGQRAAGGARVYTAAEAKNLKPGTRYRASNGILYTR
jgi:hypothetical protein